MPNINLKATNPKIIQAGLQELESSTASALADHVGLPKATVDAVMLELIRQDMIHVCAWARNKQGTRIRVFAWGKGVSAPQPIKVSQNKKQFVPSGIPDALNNPRCDIAASWMRNPVCTHL